MMGGGWDDGRKMVGGRGEVPRHAHHLRCSKVGKTKCINSKRSSLDCHHQEEPQIA